jgi:hypothetical protein
VQENVKTNLYYVNICKHEHEKNITRLWCKIIPKTNVENTKEMKGPTSIYTPLGTYFEEASKEDFMCAGLILKFIKDSKFLKPHLGS